MKTPLTLLLIILSSFTYAQNFSCFQSHAKNYFINGNGYVRGIRIDSVRASGTDSVYYPYRTTRKCNYIRDISFFSGYRIDTFGASWLGKKVIRHNDGTFLFDNMWDTVIIKSQAHTGDSWTFFNDTTRYSYKATVTSESTATILGSPDSIKTITITADSSGIAHTIDPVNNFQIVLSKNHGFVQAIDLFTFPYHRPDTVIHSSTDPYLFLRYFDFYLDVLLNNLGTCDLGPCPFDNLPDTINSVFHLFALHNPTQLEIYNFDTGDVYESHFNVGSGSTVENDYTLDSVFTKTVGPYGVTYGGNEHYARIVQDFSVFPFTYNATYDVRPYSLYVDTSHLFSENFMPEESINGFMLHYFPHLFPGGLSCDSPATYVFVTGVDFWYTDFNYEPLWDSLCYSIGFGQTGKTFNLPPHDVVQTTWLNYYHKDTTTCGEFVKAFGINTSVPTISHNTSFSANPNPASNQITIKTNNPGQQNTIVSVYDITGRTIFTDKTTLLNNFTINTTAWNNGMYYISIQNEADKIWMDKIVIIH